MGTATNNNYSCDLDWSAISNKELKKLKTSGILLRNSRLYYARPIF